MTHDDRSLERAARLWIEDGPRRAPDHVIDGALRTITTTPQERDWLPRRFSTMTIPARLGVAAAVGALLVGGLVLNLNRPGPSVGTNPSPTTSPATPSPSVSVRADHSDYAGRLLVQHLGNAPDCSESDAPDGSYGTRRLFLMNPDGTGIEELAPGQPVDGKLHADVSSDYSKVAFMDNSQDPKIHEVNLDGTGFRTITDCDCGEGQPAYSPDMSRIAFVRWEGETATIAVRDLATNEVTLLPETADTWAEGREGQWPEHPSWSPDGSGVIYALLHYDENGTVNSSKILRIDVETRQIEDLAVPPELFFGEPRYSPDGSLILLASGSAETTLGRSWGDVYTVRPDGSGLTLLTDRNSIKKNNRMIDNGTGASWTPDGRILFFANNQHWIMNADGTDFGIWDSGQPDLAEDPVGYSYTAYWIPSR